MGSNISLKYVCAVGAVVGGMAFSGDAVAAVYLNDTFADNERSTQSLPDSAAWIVGAHHSTAANAYGTLDATSGKLVLDHSNGSNSFAAVIGHFAPAGSPIALAEGETMILTFDVSFSGGSTVTNDGALRWALLNSGGNRVSSDFAGTNQSGIASGSTFNAWRGYEGQSPIHTSSSSGSASFYVRERDKNHNGLFTSDAWTKHNGSAVVESAIAATTVYAVSLSLTRTASGMDVQAGLAGNTTTLLSDASPATTSFDSVAVFTIDGLSHNITFDNIKVEVVPEPSAIALLAVGGVALLRRRR